jgi:hypothetical protein
MNNKVLAGIAAGLFAVAALVTVGVVAYNAGERSDRTVQVVGEVATTGEATTRTVVLPDGYWHGGWRGPGFGFLIFPLIVIGLVLLFASRRRGPRWYDDDLRAWHRGQHADDATAAVPSDHST